MGEMGIELVVPTAESRRGQRSRCWWGLDCGSGTRAAGTPDSTCLDASLPGFHGKETFAS